MAHYHKHMVMSHVLMEISHVLMLISHVFVCLHMLMRFHYKLEWGNYLTDHIGSVAPTKGLVHTYPTPWNLSLQNPSLWLLCSISPSSVLIKSRSMASARLSAYADWLQAHRQTPYDEHLIQLTALLIFCLVLKFICLMVNCLNIDNDHLPILH